MEVCTSALGPWLVRHWISSHSVMVLPLLPGERRAKVGTGYSSLVAVVKILASTRLRTSMYSSLASSVSSLFTPAGMARAGYITWLSLEEPSVPMEVTAVLQSKVSWGSSITIILATGG